MSPDFLHLTGADLRIRQVGQFVARPAQPVALAPDVASAARRSRAFLEERVAQTLVYGVNTGFGPMASRVIPAADMTALQYNLVLGHAVGIGDPLPDDYVLAMMLVRLNTLAKGYSGVSYELLEMLAACLSERIVPLIPEHGSVGASGDLVQLAHIALMLIGHGEVRYRGERRPAGDALRSIGRAPYALKPKEGLSLINGTSSMAGIGSLLCLQAERLLSLAVRNGALALELVSAFDDAFAEGLHARRPHVGQREIAGALRDLLRDSTLLSARESMYSAAPESGSPTALPEPVQQVYSFRCIPQILGPVLDTLRKTWNDVETEINSVTDNPIVDVEARRILHGGNFHGDYVAVSIDQLKAGLTRVTMLSERRVNFLLNEAANRQRFPPFLNLVTPGLTLGLQGLQFVATSTTAINQSLSAPHAVHSIPTNADNQDIVSLGTDAALLAMRVAENALVVLTIEAIALAQAVDCAGIAEQLCPESRALYAAIREECPTLREDRVLGPDLVKVIERLRRDPAIGLEWA